jgi:tRNA dimethylallyltransferase
MQIYKNMNIGTAKPTVSEMCEIKHHLIDIFDVCTPYSVSDYVKDAEKCVADIFSKGKLPVFCGGTGLYIDSYLSGINFGEYQNNSEVREDLIRFFDENGVDALYQKLKECDDESARKIAPENIKRVIRALEVYQSTGVTLSEWNRRSVENSNKKDALVLFLDFDDRQLLYSRIDKRVDLMLEMGILEEAERLIKMGIKNSPTACQAIGYKEFYPYFDNTETLENCIEKLKLNSRHYAKRQLTWFKRNKDAVRIAMDNLDSSQAFEKCVSVIDLYLTKGEK